MAFWIPLAMAGAGALMGAKKAQREREIEDADRKLAGETERYSWVTGNKAAPIRRAGSTFANIGQGALSGGMFGMQFAGGGAAPKPDAGSTTAMVEPGMAGGQQKSFWHDMQAEDPNNPWFKPVT